MSSCNGVVLQPHPCRNMDGLGCSPFARHYWGNHCLFSFPAGTKMFQFPALASCYARCHSFRMTGCPIRKSSDQRLFAPTRSLSQLITSFIASVSLGIRHTPLFAFPMKISSRTCGTTHSALYFNVVFSTVLLVPICQRSFVLKRTRGE